MTFCASQIEKIAINLLGEPNRTLSSQHELRFGTHGSLSIDLEKGAFFDHEAGEGGGIFDLIQREGHDPRGWLEGHGFGRLRNGGYGDRRTKQADDFHIVAIYPYTDENGAEIFQCCRMENGKIGPDGKREKKFTQRRLNGDGGYIYSIKGIRRVPYRFPQLIEAIASGQIIFIPEGEKCADAICELGLSATTNAGGAGKWQDEITPYFKDADVVILPDNDEPGCKHAKLVARRLNGIAKCIRILEPPGLLPKDDVVNWVAAGGTRDKLLRLAEAAPDCLFQEDKPELTETEIEDEVRRLAKLSTLHYTIKRDATAKRLNLSVRVLDKLVNDQRKGSNPQGQGRPLEFSEPEPWHEPVSGADLLNEIEATFSRFVICEPSARVALALWICATWLEAVAQVAPILNIASPVMRCGKSTVLSIIGKLAKRPLTSASISPAAVFRTIEKHAPTLLIDEADSFLGENEELRGVINSGHTRDTAFVVRTVGDDHEPKQFSTWGFKAIAGIGKRAATIEDRAITISLKRKLASEKIARLRHANPGLFETLARKLVGFAADNMAKIAEARPELAEALNDRAQDNWEPLVAIADAAGGAWPQMAREAALALSGANDEPASLGEELLRDIRDLLAEKDAGHAQKRIVNIASADLVDALVEMKDRPWGERNRGRHITQAWLARNLGHFGIESKKVRVETSLGSTKPLQGYERKSFDEAFSRYLPPKTLFQSGTVEHNNRINGLYENQSGTPGDDVRLLKSAHELKTKDCSGVPLSGPPFGADRAVGVESLLPKQNSVMGAQTPDELEWGLEE